jgi:hypothetical protein
MNKQLFVKSNKVEKWTLFVDFLAIVVYIALFLTLFNLLLLPDIVNGSMDLDILQYMEPIYEFLGRNLDKWQMNTIISLSVAFTIVGIPMFFINLKKVRTRTIYEVDSYVAGSKFFQGLINLLSFNPISCGLLKDTMSRNSLKALVLL